MPEQLTEQERLFGVREQSYGTFSIPNRDLYPFIGAARALSDECKLEWTGNELYILMVDAANVGMLDLSLSIENDTDPFLAGVNLKRLAGRLQNRPRGSDSVEIHLELAYPTSILTVDQEVANGRVWNVRERIPMLDPDSVRSRPDLPELDYDIELQLDVSALRQYVNTLPDDSKPVEFGIENGELQIGQIGGEDDHGEFDYYSLATVERTDADGEGQSIYSIEYIKDMLRGMGLLGVETVIAEWSTEFPLRLSFETDCYYGSYLLAPRIRK